jgi:hypothetical protein
MGRAATLPLFVLVAAGAGTLLTPPPRPGFPVFAYDTYAQFLPNALHAMRALRADPGGLLWNPYQNCGQPFFANPLTGLLYPPHLLFLVLAPDAALRAIGVVNLCIAGVGAYALARELGAGRAAALAGGLAFQLGNTSLVMATWSPMHGGPFAWFPLALLAAERLLRRPDAIRATLLGLVLACALLPGFPIVVLLMDAVVVLRVVWALVTREVRRPVPVLCAAAAGLALPGLLAAVQLFPAIEFARLGMRKLPFASTADDVMTIGRWRRALALRKADDNPFVLVPCLLASVAILGRRARVATFHLLAVVPFTALACGAAASWYAGGALGSVVRSPVRFTWPIALCLAVATALGVETLTTPATSRLARTARVLLPAVVLLAFHRATPGGLVPREWALGIVVVLAAAVSGSGPSPMRGLATACLVGAVLANAIVAPAGFLQQPLPSMAPLRAHAGVFERLRARLSPQDRVALVHQNAGATTFGVMAKSATLFRLPSINDYEPQASLRWARYFVMMRSGRALSDPNEMLLLSAGWTLGGLDHRLLDLTAARYVAADATLARQADAVAPPRLEPLFDDGTLRVYENPTALPRARFVPRVEIVADDRRLLDRLAHGSDDLRTVALVDASPPSGFLGADGPADVPVAVVRDDAAHLVLRVDSPRPGFLVLADQDYPGWRATVNGDPAPIVRANLVFRAVEVPAGSSIVDMRYLPPGLVGGALVSLATVAALGAILVRRRRRRLASAAPAPAAAA